MSEGQTAAESWVLPLSSAEARLVGDAMPAVRTWVDPRLREDACLWVVTVPAGVDPSALDFLLRGLAGGDRTPTSVVDLLTAARNAEPSRRWGGRLERGLD